MPTIPTHVIRVFDGPGVGARQANRKNRAVRSRTELQPRRRSPRPVDGD